MELDNPEMTTATVSVPTSSLQTGIDLRDEHLHSENWLDAANNPNISFTVTGVDAASGAVLTHGETADVTVEGNLTLNGVTRAVEVPAEVTFYRIEGDEVAGTYGLERDIVRISTTFDIELDEYDVTIPAPLRTKVNNTINLEIRLTAQVAEEVGQTG